MKRFRYIFFAVLLAMMWLGINVYADEYDGLDFDYGSVLVAVKTADYRCCFNVFRPV